MKLRTSVTETVKHMRIIAWSLNLNVKHLDNFKLCKKIVESLMN